MNENQNQESFKLTPDQQEELRRQVAERRFPRRVGRLAAGSARHLARLEALTPTPTKSFEEQIQEDLARRQQNDTEH